MSQFYNGPDILPSFVGDRNDVLRAMSLTNSTLQLIVLPTEQCNFRCTYCYEDFSIGNMKEVVVQSIVKLIQRRFPELETLRISYFGGEPLLNFKAIETISGTSQTLSNSFPGKKFLSDMTTNGYLLNEERLARLVSFGCHAFQISLDGYGGDHEITRKSRNGLPNFNVIWNNLLAAKNSKLDFHIALRVHLRPSGEESTIKLMEEIKKVFPDPRFSVTFKQINDLGGESKQHPDIFTKSMKKRRDDLIDILREIEFNRQSLFQDKSGNENKSLVNTDNYFGFNSICYAGRANSIVIRANGRINKCTVALKRQENDVGYIDDNGHVILDNAKIAPWLNGLVSMDKATLFCPANSVLSN